MDTNNAERVIFPLQPEKGYGSIRSDTGEFWWRWLTLPILMVLMVLAFVITGIYEGNQKGASTEGR